MTKILLILFYSDCENYKEYIIIIGGGKHDVCCTNVIKSQQNNYLSTKMIG